MANLHFFAWIPALSLTCLGLSSLVAQLVFAVLAPLVIALCGMLVAALFRVRFVQSLPYLLIWGYLVFPSVASRGFRALAPCDCFENLGRLETCFLRTDYEVQCTADGTPPLAVIAAAWLAILIYGVAVPAAFAVLLFISRLELTRKAPPNDLSAAASFLSTGYTSAMYWWELFEVMKKLVLTGFISLGMCAAFQPPHT